MIQGMYLNGEWVSADDPRAKPWIDAEKARVKAAKQRAREFGWELLTPLSVTDLFGVTASAVRQARLNGYVYAPFKFNVTDKDLHLLDLGSAVEYWDARKPVDFDAKLEKMRENGITLGVNNVCYNVLHTRPLTSMDDAIN